MLAGVLIAAAAIVAIPNHAQAQVSADTPIPTVEGLTVTAPGRLDAKRLPSLAFKFVQSHGAPGRIGQLTRWGVAPCPVTAGLPEPMNAFVSDRIRNLAGQVGAPPSRKPDCTMNLLVVFTDKPQALMDYVRRRRPQLLGFHYVAQRKRLATINRPIQAWYVTGTKSSAPSSSNVANNNTGGLAQLDDPFEPMPGGSPGSRLTAGISSEFLAVLVVVDATKMAGQPIGAIADHVAVLSLTRPPESQPCRELPSVLDVMNPDCPADRGVNAVTAWDLAYLKGLYRIDAEEHLPLLRGRITDRMVREAKDPQPAPR